MRSAFLIIFALGIIEAMALFNLSIAQYAGTSSNASAGVEALSDLDEIPEQYGKNQPSYPGYPYPYPGQTYLPYPPVYAQPQPPPARKTWLGKLFYPITKHMSPPVYQPEKVSKEPPRETQILKDPLLRLAKGLQYKGQTVAPGFYLLSLVKGNGDDSGFLTLSRQQHLFLQVPVAHATPIAELSSKPVNLPSPPDKTSKKEKNKVVEDASAHAELAEDGQNIILVYQTRDHRYASIPLAVDAPWLAQ